MNLDELRHSCKSDYCWSMTEKTLSRFNIVFPKIFSEIRISYNIMSILNIMKNILSFIYQNHKYYLTIDGNKATILDNKQTKIYENDIIHLQTSTDPLILFAFKIYNSLVC